MLVQQFFVNGLAHSSYLLGGSSICAIVDPRRDVDVYLAAAKSLGMKITHILETHLHADFISGHMDLAEKTGAKIYAPKAGNCKFEHVGVVEGDAFEIEDMKLSVLDTAGHTPEHIRNTSRTLCATWREAKNPSGSSAATRSLWETWGVRTCFREKQGNSPRSCSTTCMGNF